MNRILEELKNEINFDKYKEELPKIHNALEGLLSSEKYINQLKEEMDDINVEECPTFNLNKGNLAIIFGAPICTEEKSLKFEKLLRKVLKGYGIDEEHILDIKFSFDEDKKTTGSIILKFINEEFALKAINNLDNSVVKGTSIKFSCYSMNKFDFLVENEIEDVNLDRLSFLKEDIKNDSNKSQIVFLDENKKINLYNYNNIKESFEIDNSIEVNYNDKSRKNPIKVSPNSTFFALLNNSKIDIYLSSNLKLLSSIDHYLVKDIKFSFNERYLFSFNGTYNNTLNNENIILWDILCGKKLLVFKTNSSNYFNDFNFSYNSEYFSSLIGSDEKYLYVYKLPSIQKVKCPISKEICNWQIKNIKNVYWSTLSNKLIIENHEKNYSNLFLINIENENKIHKINWKPIKYDIKAVKIDWISENQLIIVKEILQGKKKSFILQNVKILSNKIEAMIYNLTIKSLSDSCIGYFNKYYMLLGKQIDDTWTEILFNIENSKIDVVYEKNKSKYSNCIFSQNSEFFILFNPKIGDLNINFIDFNTSKKSKVKREIKSLGECRKDDFRNCDLVFEEFGRYFMVLNKNLETIQMYNLNLRELDKISNISIKSVFMKKRNNIFLSQFNKKISEPKINKQFIENYQKENKKILNREEYEADLRKEEKIKKMKLHIQNKQEQWKKLLEERINRIYYNEEELENHSIVYLLDKKEKVIEKLEKIEY